MDPKKIHFIENNKKREQNLEEDSQVWKFLLTLEDDDTDLEIFLNNSQNYKIKYNNTEKINAGLIFQSSTKTKKIFFQERVKTLCEKIWDMRSNYYELDKQLDINIKNLKHFANSILKSDKSVQLEFCRQPTRQSMHQKNQLNMLTNNLNKEFWTVYHPKEGEINIDGENIVDNKSLKKKFSKDARSVDVIIETKKTTDKKIYYGFLKFSKEQGTATTTHQLNEAKKWLQQAMNYSQARDDNINFFCISDGKEGERNIPILQKAVRYHKERIFVGNTEQVLEFLKKNEKKLSDN